MSNIHSQNQTMLQQQIENFNQERNSILEKLEKMAQDLANKEKDYAGMLYKKEQIETALKLKEKELDEMKTEQS